MLRALRFRRARTLSIVAAALALGATAAWAAIPGSDGVIHGCYNASSNPSGQLRVIDPATGANCAKNEKALAFNQTGPKGDKGDQGIQGAQGIQGTPGTNGTNGADGTNGTNGTNGTSDVHQASNGVDAGPLSVSVPAGSYLVVANAGVYNQDTGGSQVAVCSLQGTVVTAQEELNSGDFGSTADMPIMGTVTLNNPGTITINCGGYNIGTTFMRMFVTRVTTIING